MLRRRTTARAPGPLTGRCPSPAGWPRRRPNPAAARPPPPSRPAFGPGAWASLSGHRRRAPRNWHRPPHRDHLCRRPERADPARSDGSVARQMRRTHPCRSAAPNARPPGLSPAWRSQPARHRRSRPRLPLSRGGQRDRSWWPGSRRQSGRGESAPSRPAQPAPPSPPQSGR